MATCPATRSPRSFEPRTPKASSPRSALREHTRLDCRAGSSANSTVVSPRRYEREDEDAVIEIERQDACEGRRGWRQRSEEDVATPTRTSAAASASPHAAGKQRQEHAFRQERHDDARLACADGSRTPISRWRAAARASMMFETFAHAARRTSANAANTGERMARSSSVSGAGVACSSSCGVTPSARSTARAMKGVSACRACSGVTSRRSRAITAIFAPLIGAEQVLLEDRGVQRERQPQLGRRVVDAAESGCMTPTTVTG